ncbi:MAG: heavy metal-associated domain-containing protein [Chitinophagaceae bacterium]
MTHQYNISGLTCGNCVKKVKSELLKIGDLIGAEIDYKSGLAEIQMQKHISTKQLQEAVGRAGSYKITEENVDMSDGAVSGVSYKPLALIFGYILLVTALSQVNAGGFEIQSAMEYFMGGFFLVFSFFKLMNLTGFAEGYRTYDVVAKAIPAWGFIYPFVELALGIAFVTGFEPLLTNAVAFVVMGVSSIGVIRSLMAKKEIQCACLGTVIKLPLGKVTLVEDLLMVVMSGAMILMIV